MSKKILLKKFVECQEIHASRKLISLLYELQQQKKQEFLFSDEKDSIKVSIDDIFEDKEAFERLKDQLKYIFKWINWDLRFKATLAAGSN